MVPMRSLGQDGWKIAAALMGRHIGGGNLMDTCFLVDLYNFAVGSSFCICIFQPALLIVFPTNIHGKMHYP